MCEPLLKKHTDSSFIGVIFRPATVCGYAPRQRLDLSVNILTNHAFNKGTITVFGGDQLRPNLHIQDYADLCKLLLTAPHEKVANETFNCGFQNMSIMDIAKIVKQVVEEVFPEKVTSRSALPHPMIPVRTTLTLKNLQSLRLQAKILY